jgi:hypothetical protein
MRPSRELVTSRHRPNSYTEISPQDENPADERSSGTDQPAQMRATRSNNSYEGENYDHLRSYRNGERAAIRAARMVDAMNELYPPPNHAAFTWTNNIKVMLTFPGYKGTDQRMFNTVALDLPPSVLPRNIPDLLKDLNTYIPTVRDEDVRFTLDATIQVIKTLSSIAQQYITMGEILRQRANATHADQRKISTHAAPTQAQVNEMIKNMKPTRIEPKKDISKVATVDILKSIGL